MRQARGGFTTTLTRRSLWGALDIFPYKGVGTRRAMVDQIRRSDLESDVGRRVRGRPSSRPGQGFGGRHVGQPSGVSQPDRRGEHGRPGLIVGGVFTRLWWAGRAGVERLISWGTFSAAAERVEAKSRCGVGWRACRSSGRARDRRARWSGQQMSNYRLKLAARGRLGADARLSSRAAA